MDLNMNVTRSIESLIASGPLYDPFEELQLLLKRIEASDPALTQLEMRNQSNFSEQSCSILVRALSLNTCITSLNFFHTKVGSAGACMLFPALTHLTSMTNLDFNSAGLGSSGASHLCSALTHLSALTVLDLYNNNLTADDGARICAAAAAAGMTGLKTLNLVENGFSVSDVIGCMTWTQLNLPQPPDEFVFLADFPALVRYLMSSNRVAFVEKYHPDLPLELLQRIEASDPALTQLEIRRRGGFKEAGCRVLVRALSLNTCITSLDFFHTEVGSAGACMLFPALTHLTAMTSLDFNSAGLGSSGASHLCNAFTSLTVLTELHLVSNNLTADDGARICAAAAAASISNLKMLNLAGNNFSIPDVVGSATWNQLNLPQPPSEIISQCKDSYETLDFAPIVSYLLSKDKVSCNSIRIFVVGESTAGKTSMVKALMLPSSQCAPIDIGDRTVGIDHYNMKLLPVITTDVRIPAIDTHIWDLAGQDVYALSHAMHFSHRCVYMLVWNPHEPLNNTIFHVMQWLESLCVNVPDAHIVLVASHCKTNITDDEFFALSGEVEAAVGAKIQVLKEITQLEVDKLRTLLEDSEDETQFRKDDYEAHARSTPKLAQAEKDFLRHQVQGARGLELFAARAAAVAALPRSLRTRAADVQHAISREQLLRKRLQQLLGIRNGASPDDRAACNITVRFKSMDSVKGDGIAELRKWLYGYCRSLPFMGEMISSNWISIADVFKHFGDSVLSRSDAVALVVQHLPPLQYNINLKDDEIWSIIEFWSLVGRIFVHESQVIREPSTLSELLKPLLHHRPIEMMRLPVYQNLLVVANLQRADTRVEIQSLLNHLDSHDELTLKLLDHLSSWNVLSVEQRSSLLEFFQSGRLLCCISQRHDVRLITSRVRSKPHLTDDVDSVTADASYHALYLLPLYHIAIIAHLHSIVSSIRLEHVNLEHRSGRDSLVVHRKNYPSCACIFTVENFSACLEKNPRFTDLCSKLGDPFSCVLRVASSDFGMFKFAAECADTILQSGSFGTRYQCWVTSCIAQVASRGASSSSGTRWTLFGSSVEWSQSHSQQQLLCNLPLSRALACNHHEAVISGLSIIEMFQPRSSVFVSHAWGDGTGEFIQRLKAHVEQQTLASVWVDTSGMNQQQEMLIPAFRDALCRARVVFVALTPTYLTRPNCLRELRWALDFELAGHVRVVLMALHPAVTFGGRLQLVQDGPLKGLVFSSKEKKIKRVSPEAIALLKRLNDVHMNYLPWHELQAWRSDDEKCDWEEHRQYSQGGAVKNVCLSGGTEGLVDQTVLVIKDWLVCTVPRCASECLVMNDTDSLSASDFPSSDEANDLLDSTRYPEDSAAAEAKKRSGHQRLIVDAKMQKERMARNKLIGAAVTVAFVVALVLFQRRR